MRPLLLMLRVAPVVVAACGTQATPPRGVASSPLPLEVVVGEPAPAPVPAAPAVARVERVEVAGATAAEPEPDASAADALPKSWTGPIVPGLSFADALGKARAARDAHGRLVAPLAGAKEPALKAWFVRAQAFADQASRMYAAAFHAPDATREGRIDAIAEAAELDMTMARNLDEAGLGALPQAWRADPAVASTFEDIAVGPTRRWRDEARVLARQCVESAKESAVTTEAARRCSALRTGAPLKVVRRGADAGAPCACAAGDPLCSASLGGWCGASGH